MQETVVTEKGEVYCHIEHWPTLCTIWQEPEERCKDCPLNFVIQYCVKHTLIWEQGMTLNWEQAISKKRRDSSPAVGFGNKSDLTL